MPRNLAFGISGNAPSDGVEGVTLTCAAWTTATQTAYIAWKKVGSMVTLTVPSSIAANNGTGAANIVSTALPIHVRPAAVAYAYPAVISDATNSTGRIAVATTGVLTFARTFGANTFEHGGGNTSGVYAQSLSYRV